MMKKNAARPTCAIEALRATPFLVAALVTIEIVAAETSPRPIVSSKPATGHFVQIGSSFMVPFVETIPGTDVAFEMIPVPGIPAKNVSPFWVGKYEVTLREYREFATLYDLFQTMATGERERISEQRRVDVVSAPTPIYSPRDRFAGLESLECPAYSMTLFAAKQYTQWLSLITKSPYRLPTEVEWERACRGDGAPVAWTEKQFRRLAVFGMETEHVLPVGSREPNAWGIYDMHGNASEWVITALPESPLAADQAVHSMGPGIWPPVWISKGGNFASQLQDCMPERRFVITAEAWSEEARIPNSTTWLGSHANHACIGFRLVRPLGELDKASMSKYWDAATRHFRQLVDANLREGRGAEGIVDSHLPGLMAKVRKEQPPWLDHE
jgi:formylglycine-generating enzyme required for sulfatase activity